MKYLPTILVLAACGPQPKPAPTKNHDEIVALAALMKNHINPPFSRLTFLVENGATMPEEPRAVATELRQAAAKLQQAVAKLRTWSDPPTATDEGREVFATYATSVYGSASKLVGALDAGDRQAMRGHLKQIAEACNSCHHFFHVEETIVP